MRQNDDEFVFTSMHQIFNVNKTWRHTENSAAIKDYFALKFTSFLNYIKPIVYYLQSKFSLIVLSNANFNAQALILRKSKSHSLTHKSVQHLRNISCKMKAETVFEKLNKPSPIDGMYEQRQSPAQHVKKLREFNQKLHGFVVKTVKCNAENNYFVYVDFTLLSNLKRQSLIQAQVITIN